MTMEGVDHLNHSNQSLMVIFNSSSDNETEYCGPQLREHQMELVAINRLVSIITCSIGIVTNILVLLVLTRKAMSRSNAKAILVSIAVADLLFLISALAFNSVGYHMICIGVCVEHCYTVHVLLLVTRRFAVVTNRVSVMLMLLFAVWRYISVRDPMRLQEWFSLRRTVVAIVTCFSIEPITHFVMFLMFPVDSHHDSSICLQLYSEWTELDNGLVNDTAFWVYTVSYKLIIPIIVVIFCIVSFREVYVSSRRRSMLRNLTCLKLFRHTCVIMRAFLAVPLFFAVTELPFGIFTILETVLGTKFVIEGYLSVANVFEQLEILNSSLKFVFYVTMRKQFRDAFLSMFGKDTSKSRVAVPNINAKYGHWMKLNFLNTRQQPI